MFNLKVVDFFSTVQMIHDAVIQVIKVQKTRVPTNYHLLTLNTFITVTQEACGNLVFPLQNQGNPGYGVQHQIPIQIINQTKCTFRLSYCLVGCMHVCSTHFNNFVNINMIMHTVMG